MPDRVQTFFDALFGRDPSGRRWLPALLAAAPHAEERLGELAEVPGWLDTALAVRGASGRRACFEHPGPVPRELLRWFIDHPERLTWPEQAEQSEPTARLRRALLCDDPPGSQARAQDRARELLGARSALSREWWRFEDVTRLDCVLITPRLVVTVNGQGAGALHPASAWYPPRPKLVRDLEAARQIAAERTWATVLLADAPVPGAEDDALARSLPEAAPHLDESGLRQLRIAYLGTVTWADAAAAVGLPEAG